MKRISIFENHPECSEDCIDGMTQALQSDYEVDRFTLDDDLEEVLSGTDIVAFPGGIGDSDTHFDFFTRRDGNKIADFIDAGGFYLGICMGAYWAGSRYFDLLDDVDATQYIKREGATTRRSYGTTESVLWNNKLEDMFFYDGCSLVGDETKFRTIARYVNNDPMAIIQGNIGVIGCHPESLEYWYNKKYMRNRWHKGSHHKLLLEFVDELTR
jgi:glutamine amidotransferase-like uncharacterized protein